MKALILVVIAFVITGCATHENYKKILDTWVGQSEADLIRSWGVPINSYDAGGNTFLVYQTTRQYTTQGQPSTYSTYNVGNTYYTQEHKGYSSQSYERSCVTTFELLYGTIISWRSQGNDCTAK
jgi:hypothetical protein